jgi:hypothetical protein
MYGRNLDGPGWLVAPGDWTPRQVDEAAWSVLGVTDAGELLCTAEGTTRTRVGLRIVTPATGGARHLAVDVAAQLGVDERLVQGSIADVAGGILSEVDVATGGVAAVRFIRHSPENDRVALAAGIVEFSLVDGRVLRRVDVVGEEGRYGHVLCFHGGDLLWSDRRTLRGVPAGTATSRVILPLDFLRWSYSPAGCYGILPDQIR